VPWKRMRFKDQKVYAEVDEEGQLVTHQGRVRICYREGDERTYLAGRRNLHPLEEDIPPASRSHVVTSEDQELELVAGTSPGQLPIVIHTDGSCLGNPGPAGIGVVLTCGRHRKELSEYLGRGTNNIAELTAIQRALEQVKEPHRRILLHVDSEYALGVLTRGWKVKANQELVARVRQTLGRFPDLHLCKVEAHAGHPENERADQLAREAIKRTMAAHARQQSH
jgi:ribonuclease HI